MCTRIRCGRVLTWLTCTTSRTDMQVDVHNITEGLTCSNKSTYQMANISNIETCCMSCKNKIGGKKRERRLCLPTLFGKNP